MSDKKEEIVFGKYYDFSVKSKLALSGYHLLAAAVSPFIVSIIAAMMMVILLLFIIISPLAVMWKMVAEIWMPPLEEKNVQSADPNQPNLNPVNDGVGQDRQDDESESSP